MRKLVSGALGPLVAASTIRRSRRLAAASWSAALGGWLLPHGPLLLTAGCCLTIRCSWRLAATPRFTALGGWLLPRDLAVFSGSVTKRR